MTFYLAVIHKEPASSYGVSFPDLPGVIAAADTLDEAIAQASEVLAFAAEDWSDLTGQPFPNPRSFEELRGGGFIEGAPAGALIAAIAFREPVPLAA